jgi:hypothetical protein
MEEDDLAGSDSMRATPWSGRFRVTRGFLAGGSEGEVSTSLEADALRAPLPELFVTRCVGFDIGAKCPWDLIEEGRLGSGRMTRTTVVDSEGAGSGGWGPRMRRTFFGFGLSAGGGGNVSLMRRIRGAGALPAGSDAVVFWGGAASDLLGVERPWVCPSKSGLRGHAQESSSVSLSSTGDEGPPHTLSTPGPSSF